MKLITKKNRWFFFRELFSYMIPIILIVGTVDVFLKFMECPLHPERSAPCNVIWIIAVIYGIFLLLVIICAIISAHKLRNIKKQIENEFTESINNNFEDQVKESKKAKPKNLIVKSDKKSKKKSATDRKLSTKKTITKK